MKFDLDSIPEKLIVWGLVFLFCFLLPLLFMGLGARNPQFFSNHETILPEKESIDLTPIIIRLDSIMDRIERLEMESGLEPPKYRGQYGGRWNEN